jgi:hypothetical protein
MGSKFPIIFIYLQWLLRYKQFCDFSLNESWKTYAGPMRPPFDRNWQLIYPNYGCKKFYYTGPTRVTCDVSLLIFISFSGVTQFIIFSILSVASLQTTLNLGPQVFFN